MEHLNGTAAFFQALAPVLIGNVLTVTFVYCFAKIHQKEGIGKEERSPNLSVADHSCRGAA